MLAERMLAGLPETVTTGETLELQLDDTARVLQTERRRIYDIVNVFEVIDTVLNQIRAPESATAGPVRAADHPRIAEVDIDQGVPPEQPFADDQQAESA